MGLALVALACGGLIAAAVWLALRWKYSYWKRKNVPHLPPTPILGNYEDYMMLRKTMGESAQRICRQFPDEPYVGAYYGTEPALIIQDPELIKLITTKDFYYFNSREVADYTTKETPTQSMFFNHGDTWKVIRHNMTPLFTPVKMKNMFPLVKKCATDLENLLQYETRVSEEVDALSIMARFTMDVIGSAAFGVDTETMVKSPENNPFKKVGEMLFEISGQRVYALTFRGVWPRLFYALGFKVFPQALSDFFHNLLIGVFKERQNKPSARNDFVDLVLSFKENDYISCDNWSHLNTDKKIRLKVTDELLISQCEVLFAAGYETSATSVSFCLYELAKNEEAQKKALEEVDEYIKKHGWELEYENLSDLPYLDACIDETIRLYPALGVVMREVVEAYTLPTGLRLERGTRVHLPVFHMHRHPRHFPDPDRFRPERFLGDEKHTIRPCTYMPFGEGPRLCIGKRFGKIVTLSGVLTLLKRYRVELAPGMPREVTFEPRAFVMRPTGSIHLKFIKRH